MVMSSVDGLYYGTMLKATVRDNITVTVDYEKPATTTFEYDDVSYTYSRVNGDLTPAGGDAFISQQSGTGTHYHWAVVNNKNVYFKIENNTDIYGVNLVSSYATDVSIDSSDISGSLDNGDVCITTGSISGSVNIRINGNVNGYVDVYLKKEVYSTSGVVEVFIYGDVNDNVRVDLYGSSMGTIRSRVYVYGNVNGTISGDYVDVYGNVALSATATYSTVVYGTINGVGTDYGETIKKDIAASAKYLPFTILN